MTVPSERFSDLESAGALHHHPFLGSPHPKSGAEAPPPRPFSGTKSRVLSARPVRQAITPLPQAEPEQAARPFLGPGAGDTEPLLGRSQAKGVGIGAIEPRSHNPGKIPSTLLPEGLQKKGQRVPGLLDRCGYHFLSGRLSETVARYDWPRWAAGPS